MLTTRGGMGAATGGTCPGTPGCPGYYGEGDPAGVFQNLPVNDPGMSVAFSPGWSDVTPATPAAVSFWQRYGLYVVIGGGLVVLAELGGGRR